MNRTELIAKAKELGLTFDRNINTVKTEVIEATVNTAMESKEEVQETPVLEIKGQRGRKVSTSGNTIREKIIALGKEGLTKTAIYNQLLVEHATLNYRYVVQTLIKADIKVPRQARVFAPKEETVVSAPVAIEELAEMVH